MTVVAVGVFLAALAAIVYVLALYPIGLALFSRSREKPFKKSPLTLPLTVVLPVRNGERWIAAKIESLFQSDYPGELIRIVIVSDGSTDRTSEIVSGLNDDRISLLEIEGAGKATAINQALPLVTGELIVFTDVRQRFHPSALSELVSCFSDPQAGVVTGELVITEGTTEAEANTGLYWKYEKWIRRNLNRIDAMLGATGAIYAIRRSLVKPMPVDTLLDDVHLPLASALGGARLYFECNAKAYDIPSGLKSEFKRKVRTQAGVYQIVQRFPELLNPANRRFVHFASHKLGRLALPLFLLLMLGATPFLPDPLRAIAGIAQACFYGAGLIDPLVKEGSLLKRVTGIVRTFLVLVAAAICALRIFVTPPQKLWREARTSGSAKI